MPLGSFFSAEYATVRGHRWVPHRLLGSRGTRNSSPELVKSSSVVRDVPCSLIYTVEFDHVLVLVVRHQNRRPGSWRSRRR